MSFLLHRCYPGYLAWRWSHFRRINMPTLRRSFRSLVLVALGVATGVLTGCATSRNVDSEVRSFAGAAPVAAAASYRFERLPSQTAKSQEPLEAAAQKVLSTKGLTLDAANARYSVQLRLEADPVLPESQYLWSGIAFPNRVILAPDGSFWRQVRRPMLEPTWYRHVMQVVVRDLSTANVAFETRAVHESPWSDTLNLIPPLVEAALADFPQGQPTAKSVVVVLPPKP